MERSKEFRRARKVTLRLRDCGLFHQRINVVRCDIETLIELPQGLGKTPNRDIRERVLGKYPNVTWVESLGFLEVVVTALPLASPPFEIGQGLKDPAAIGQERTGSF